MTDIGGVLEFFVSTGLLPALAVGLVVSAVVTALVLRQGWLVAPRWLVFAAVLSVVGVLAFTVLREGVPFVQAIASGAPLSPPGWRGLRDWSPDGWWRATADPLGSAQVLLNVALFVPAGFAWTLLARRPWRVLAALGALSVVIADASSSCGTRPGPAWNELPGGSASSPACEISRRPGRRSVQNARSPRIRGLPSPRRVGTRRNARCERSTNPAISPRCRTCPTLTAP